MKKIFLVLLITLFAFPLFSQTVCINDNNRERLMKKFFSVDTVKKDTTTIIQYTLYVDRLVKYVYPFSYRSFYNRYRYYPYYNNYWSYNYTWWYYNNWYNPYWFYLDSWYYDNYLGWYGNNYRYYHRRYWNYHNPYYKPKQYRQRSITSKVTRQVKSDNIRTATSRNERYLRANSSRNYSRTRQPKTYENTRPNNNRSSYTRTNRRTRSYNTPRRSKSTTVKSGGSLSRSSGTSKSSSKNRSSRRR